MNSHLGLNPSGYHIGPKNNFSILPNVDSSINQFKSYLEEDEPFWIGNLDRIKNTLQVWKEKLPNIQIYYAMKCCNEPNLLEYLAKMILDLIVQVKKKSNRYLGLASIHQK
jgi:hypothetical protein